MLYGVTRKVAIPILLLSLLGWITYGVGFGIRNFRYKEVADRTAASPDYIFFWIFLCSGPIVLAFSFLQALWESRVTSLLGSLFLPFFLIGAGAVLFFNGSIIYVFYQRQSNVNLICIDNLAVSNLPYHIHREFRFVPIEFAGVVMSSLFYWIFLMMAPFFASKRSREDYFLLRNPKQYGYVRHVITVMLEGVSNKIAFTFVLLSACFWVVYVTGFGIRYQQMDSTDGTVVVNITYVFHWCFSVSGILVYLLSFLHLLCGSTATAILMFLLVPLYLVSVGGVLNVDGLYLYAYYTNTTSDYEDYVWPEFGGALCAVLLYWVSMMMWVCHSYSNSRHRGRMGGYERLN